VLLSFCTGFYARRCDPFGTTSVKTAENAYYYARFVIKGGWLEGEPIIATNPKWAYNYACDIIEGQWLEGEPIIATDPRWAYNYACDVIKGRFLGGELSIMFSEYFPDYAKLCGMNYYECK
jgi:hypothetical protein